MFGGRNPLGGVGSSGIGTNGVGNMYGRGGDLLGGGAGPEGYAGSKRPRVADGSSFFGGTAGALGAGFVPGLGGVDTGVSSFYPSRKFPVVKCRGLPFHAAENDVVEFFTGLDVVDVLMRRKEGPEGIPRFSGEAFVVFGAPMQVDFALQRNRQNMGRRYVEIFPAKKPDYYAAVAAEVAMGFDERPPQQDADGGRYTNAAPRAGGGGGLRSQVDKESMEYTGVLRLRGLPYSVSKADIIEFFTEWGLVDDNIHIVSAADGRATGEAFVEFNSAKDAKDAMVKDYNKIGSRYVELFPSSRDEATRAATRGR